MFYDVMFESEEWRLLASSVDDHSSSIGDNDAKRIFLESVRGPLSVKANYVLDKLGLKKRKSASRTTRATRSKKNTQKKRMTNTSRGTRKSMRLRNQRSASSANDS